MPMAFATASADRTRTALHRKLHRHRRGALVCLVLALGAVVMVFPFAWMVLSAFKQPAQIITYPPVWIPRPWTLANFQRAWTMTNLDRLFANSLAQAVVATSLTLVTSSLSGYVLAKFRFPGRGLIFIAILCTMMIPWPVFLLPQYLIVVRLKLMDTRMALIVPAAYSSFGIFLLRQYMHTVPNELLDAARIDGAGEHRIFWRIAFPLCRPALAALGIFTFLGNWDSLLWPLIVLNSKGLFTLPMGMVLGVQQFWTEYGVVMATAVISVLPVVAVYLVFQRSFVEGVALTGMKA